ncbi:GNAT family N-acetyltransferase [Ramlibacter sp. XY19]|uniref:GNAT family N-acetyltransferase n=1 Tax=Ramlibacter paludis TaxID=2908000 RepID=UPI0023D9CDCC|nr:GNAT family N-acetyltransferase [Ramlibacter paludis]MCG2592893.1 GNAT family N-acetyltransferase [Ramlibacter paludis]
MPYAVEPRKPDAQELAALLDAMDWGTNSPETVARSIAAYPCTICATTDEGALVGYLSAFSDGVMSTMLGELVVHPAHQRRGLASRMLELLAARYPEAPIYVKALGKSKDFYAARGFKIPSAEMTVMFRRPGQMQSIAP